MILRQSLTDIADEFVMELGVQGLQDIDTPSFVRKELGVELMDSDTTRTMRQVIEPDEKITKFLAVLKRNDFAIAH